MELRHTVESYGILFNADGPNGSIAVSDWPDAEWDGPRPDVLYRLFDDDLAEALDGGRVLLVHPTVASLSPRELLSLGLPKAADFSLRLRSINTLVSPEGQLEAVLIRKGGIPVLSPKRQGSVLTVGDEQYVLLDPLYSVLDRVDEFNRGSRSDPLAAWGRLRELLPEEAEIDDYLAGVKVSFASSFKLAPFLNELGEPDFDVLPGRTEDTPVPDAPPVFAEALPPARSEEFARHFRKLSRARAHYAAGTGWFVAFSEAMTDAVAAIKGIQNASPAVRREFLLRPHAVLKERLPQLQPGEVEALFYDIGYSDRVKGIGLWEKKILPWVKKASDPWLPPEQLGIRVGDDYVRIEPSDLDEVRRQVEEALESGAPYVEYKGHKIPAVPQALEALDGLVGERKPDVTKPGPDFSAADAQGPTSGRVVLQIHGNLEEVEFRAARRPRGPGIRQATPWALRSTLFAHQTEAVEWLQQHWESGSPGALLADDMGLGKTLEALAFLAWARELMATEAYPTLPCVIVAPAGLLENWKEEVSRHLEEPGLGVLVEAYGSSLRQLKSSTTIELRQGVSILDTAELQRADWVLTTYETWRDYQHSFGKIRWAVGVFDEVQKIKNPGALITEAAKAIQADFVIGLTGTPVENRLADLWSIADLVQPGRLGTLKEFSHKFESSSPERSAEALSELKEKVLVAPPAVMKRRLKEDHVEGLPEKEFIWPKLLMPAGQAAAYEQAIEAARGAGRGGMLQALGQLRSVSLHPSLMAGVTDEEYIQESGRLIATFEILDKVHAAGEKALVFLESREMQATLIAVIHRRYRTRERPMVVNGAVAGKLRQQRVNAFQSRDGFDVMILSPKAGGVGLTLTSANHVIHVSRWWNPAVEDQCTDRVFRIGQEKKVSVYHPMAVHPEYQDHSFDITLDGLLRRKRAMSRAVLAPTALSPEDVERLYQETLLRPDKVAPSDIDGFDPIQFEDWVMNQLRNAGYRVERTPRSHDYGADAVAHPPLGAGKPPILVQCKHTQRSQACGAEGVEEVARSKRAYRLDPEPSLLLVTNAGTFTAGAREAAKREGVTLVGRDGLAGLRTGIGLR